MISGAAEPEQTTTQGGGGHKNQGLESWSGAPRVGGPAPKMKSVIVASYPRSGTHFFMASLHRAFGYPAKPLELDATHTLGPAGSLHKTHRPPGAMVPNWFGWTHVFHVRRNPLDVLVSLHHYHHANPKCGWILTDRPADLADTNPIGEAVFASQDDYIRAWAAHCLQWRRCLLPYTEVRYEDLVNDYPGTIRMVGRVLAMEPKDLTPPPLVGNNPRKGKIASSLEEFTPEEIYRVSGKVIDDLLDLS